METIEKAYIFAFYPTKTQKKLLANWFGGCRAIYNIMLNEQTEAYKAWNESDPKTRGKAPFMNYVTMSSRLTEMKRNELPWLNEISSVALQESLKTLEKSYKNFFAKRGGYPRFKSKSNVQSLSLTYRGFTYDSSISQLKFSRGRMKLRGGRLLPNCPLRITITKDNIGKYHVKAICRIAADSVIESHTKQKSIGIDMGIKEFATFSNNTSVKLLPILKPYYEKLKTKQRKLSKVIEMIKKTKNVEELAALQLLKNKYRKIVTRAHIKIVNVRKDILHKLTRKLVSSYRAIGMEGLRIVNMVRSAKQSQTLKHNLPRTIMQSCWGEFFRQLIYKATWSQSTKIIVMHPEFPSTQIHNTCGIKSKSKVPLSSRIWHCSHCKDSVDRDYNAALNIKAITDWVMKTFSQTSGTIILSGNKESVWI